MAKKRKNRLTIDFKQVEEYYERLDRAGSNLKKITDKALQESYELMTPGIKKTTQPHRLTGDTEESLREHEKVKWDGNTAQIDVGFSIREGGLPSIFLMYGTPKMDPDKKLYNSIYGSTTKKKIRELQKETFDDELRKVME